VEEAPHSFLWCIFYNGVCVCVCVCVCVDGWMDGCVTVFGVQTSYKFYGFLKENLIV
jgi:hypothetical protein